MRRPDAGSDGALILRLGIGAMVALVAVAGLAFAFGLTIDPTVSDPSSASSEGTDPLARLVSNPDPADSAGVVTIGQLPEEIDESSGVAISGSHDDLMWTHNDKPGRPFLYALRTDGTRVGRVEVVGAQAFDWEDLALAGCPPESGRGDCLYVADIGDNDAVRTDVRVYVVPEPDPQADRARVAREIVFRYPDGPADAEAFAVAGGWGFVITKGDDGEARLYRGRIAGGSDGAEPALLERIGVLPVDVSSDSGRITGASVSPDGGTLAVRSHEAVYLVPVDRPLEHPVLCRIGDVQPQGEGVAFYASGLLLLTSERSDGDAPIVRVRCP